MSAVINPPIGLTAVAFRTSTINLSWQNPEGSGDNVLIYRSTNGTTYTLIVTLAGTDRAYSDTTCGDGTLYYYRARGWSDLYGYSNYSNVTTATTALPAPSNLAGVANSTSKITLTWQDNSHNETGFEIYMKKEGGSYASLGTPTTAANVETYVKSTGLAASTLYYFKIKATNAATSSIFSNAITVATNDPDTETYPITLSNTGHQDILIIDTVNATIIKAPVITVPTTVTLSDVLTNTFDVVATDGAIHKFDTTHADNEYPVSSYIRTKDLDFTDQHPDISGMMKTIRKLRLIYEDIDADTPITAYISNDGGINWSTSSATVGTGDGRVKTQDFYFMNSEYVTGLNFTFKVDCLSAITDLVSNGTFTGVTTDWTLGAGWAYETNDVRRSASTVTTMTQAMSTTPSFPYIVVYTISSYSAGGVTVSLGGTDGTQRTANGTYTETITPVNSTSGLVFTPTAAGAFDLDTVTVKPARARTFLWLAFEIEFFVRGEHFNV